MLEIGIHGAGGRVGQRLMALIAEDDDLRLHAAIERAGHGDLGGAVGEVYGVRGCDGVVITDNLPDGCDVVIDFSSPPGTRNILRACTEKRVPLVIGTTGLTKEDHDAIDQSASSIAVLQAPNMSLGVNLLMILAAQAAKQLGDDYDIEIVEAHHRFKKDAPSGTALGLAESICNAKGRDMDTTLVDGYYGKEGSRQPGQIGMHAMRMGDVVGEHSVYYSTLGERIELRHVATDRDIFVRGALRAGKWLVGKPAGRYGMRDVLGVGVGVGVG